MKKLLAVTVIAGLAGTLAHGQVTQVVSRNAVGYVRMDIPAASTNGNGLFMGSIPFYEVGGDGVHTIGEIFGGQLNGGASLGLSDNVLKFDPSNQTYITFWKNLSGQWRQFPEGVATTNKLLPGEGFWVINRKSTGQVVYVMGEVPDSNTLPSGTQSVSGLAGLQLLSYAFPTEVPINSSKLKTFAKRGASLGLSDNIQMWDETNRTYVTYWLPTSTNFGWRKFPEGADTTDAFRPGRGFWYKRYAGQPPFTWSEAKPYTWP